MDIGEGIPFRSHWDDTARWQCDRCRFCVAKCRKLVPRTFLDVRAVKAFAGHYGIEQLPE